MRRVPLPLVPFLAATLLHLGALRGGFHFDDEHAVVRNPAVQDLRNAPLFFTDPARFSASGEGAMYRPVTLSLHAVNAAQARTSSPLPWVATNLLLHAACSAGLFLLVREVLRRSGSIRPEVAALAASLLFAVHPLATEVVNYVSARSSSLAFAFAIGALLAHLRAREGSRLAWAGSLLLGALAMLSRETAVALPLLVGTVELLLPGFARARVLRTLPCLAVTGAFLALRAHLLGGVVGPAAAVPDVEPEAGWGRSPETNFVLQSLAAVRFLGLVLWPGGLTVDHTFPRPSGLGDPLFFSSAAILLVVAAAAFALRRRPACLLGFVLLASGLAPYFFAPLNVVFAEHRAYPSLAGACLVLGDGAAAALAAWPRRALALRGAAAVLLLGLATRAAARDLDWRGGESDLPLWESAVRVSPDSFRAHHGLANGLFESGDLDGAERHYREALRIYPRYDAARISLAGALLRRGGGPALDEAVALLEELLARRPAHVLARFRLAAALQARFLLSGDLADASRCDRLLSSLAEENPADRSARTLLELFRRERERG